MLQILMLFGLGIMGALVFDLVSDDEPEETDEGDGFDIDTGETPDDLGVTLLGDKVVMGTEGDDDLSTAPDNPQSMLTASETLEDHVNDEAETVSALEGNDQIEISNGDHVIGGRGSDMFVVNYSFDSELGAAVVEDFDPNDETIVLQIGGAPSNALPDHETFYLTDDVEVEESEEAGTTILVEGEVACEIPEATGLTVVWAHNAVSPDHIIDTNQEFFNLDGTLYEGARSDIDLVVYRFYNYSS